MFVPFVTSKPKLERRKGGGGGKGDRGSVKLADKITGGLSSSASGSRSSSASTSSGAKGTTSYSNGSKSTTIPSGSLFACRAEGGRTRDQVYGTSTYGSGYPTVTDRGFPFYFWPLAWGGVGTTEHGRPDITSRPGRVKNTTRDRVHDTGTYGDDVRIASYLRLDYIPVGSGDGTVILDSLSLSNMHLNGTLSVHGSYKQVAVRLTYNGGMPVQIPAAPVYDQPPLQGTSKDPTPDNSFYRYQFSIPLSHFLVTHRSLPFSTKLSLAIRLGEEWYGNWEPALSIHPAQHREDASRSNREGAPNSRSSFGRPQADDLERGKSAENSRHELWKQDYENVKNQCTHSVASVALIIGVCSASSSFLPQNPTAHEVGTLTVTSSVILLAHTFTSFCFISKMSDDRCNHHVEATRGKKASFSYWIVWARTALPICWAAITILLVLVLFLASGWNDNSDSADRSLFGIRILSLSGLISMVLHLVCWIIKVEPRQESLFPLEGRQQVEDECN